MAEARPTAGRIMSGSGVPAIPCSTGAGRTDAYIRTDTSPPSLYLSSATNTWVAATPSDAAKANLAGGNSFTGAQIITASSAAAFSIGANGDTNPVLRIITNVGSQADGISISGGAAGAGTTFTGLSSGSNSPITLATKGAGQVLVPPGTSFTTVPSLSFIGSLDTGLACDGANLIVFESNKAALCVTDSSRTYRVPSDYLYAWSSATNNLSGVDTNVSRSAAGTVQVGTTAANASGHLKAASIRGNAVAFASVPATPVEGMMCGVTDSSTATWGATITGGGANHVLAYYNGTNWTVAGK